MDTDGLFIPFAPEVSGAR